MKKILLLNAVLFVILSISCTRAPQLAPLKETKNPDNLKVSLSGRYWQSMYTPNNSFELKFSNNSGISLENCVIMINDQFKHELKDLKVKMNNEKTYSIMGSNALNGNESIAIMFDQESRNMEKFHINANIFFKPKKIILISDNGTIQWLFDLPLQKSYF